MIKFLETNDLQTHGSIQQKENLITAIFMNYLILPTTNFHEEFTCERLGWTINSIPLPKDLQNLMKRLIKIQNRDNKYLNLCLVRYLNHINKNRAKI